MFGIRWVPAYLMLATVGCLNSDNYIAKYTDVQCAYALDCFDEAILAFYGWDTQEACVADFGPRVTAAAETCSLYDRGAARQCLKALEEMTCPADGEDPVFPTVCETVFNYCASGSTDTDTDSTDTDGSDDTDGSNDTDADT